MNEKQDARKYAQKGRSANQARNYKAAFVYFSRAIKLNKEKSQYYFGAAHALAEQGRFKEACIHWKRVVMMNPKDAAAYYNLGYVLERLGKIDESIETYKEAIRLDPDDADGYENLAMVLSTKGNFEEAHEHYLKALQIKPSHAFNITNGIGCLYFLQGEFGKAIEEFQKSIRLKGKFTDAYWNMSLVLFCEKKDEEAVKFFEDGMKTLEEEESRIKMMKEAIVSNTDIKMRFEVKLNNNNADERLNEEKMKFFRMMIDGLTKIINLSTQYLEK